MKRPLHHHLKHAFIPHAGNDHRPHALRSKWLRVYAGLALTVKLAAAILIAFAPNASYLSNITASNIIRLTNESRAAAGLTALGSNGLLGQAAQAKANDMIANGYFAHTSPSNVTPWAWFQRAGYSYKYAGENLAKDFSTSEDVVAAWLASPSHKKNIMNANYKEIGVAVATGTVNGVTTIVIAQMFGTPLTTPLEVAQAPTHSDTATQPSGSVQGTETPAPVTPDRPVFRSPAAEALLNDATPTISGTTSPSVTVELREGETVIASGTSGSDGTFSLTPTSALSDGAHTLTALARSSSQASEASESLKVSIDTAAPTLELAGSFILPTWEPRSNYLVVAEVGAEPNVVSAAYSGHETPLAYTALGYYGYLDGTKTGQPSDDISILATDAAKNVLRVPMLSAGYFKVDVVEPEGSLTPERLLTLMLTSRTILLALLAFLAIALALNVFIRFRIQHHPTIVSTLLLMYTVAIMLIV